MDTARSLLERQRYEDAIRTAAEASQQARIAYATATAEADRRRIRRQQEIQRRQLEESFARITRTVNGSDDYWVVEFPSGRKARFGTNQETRIRKGGDTSPQDDESARHREVRAERNLDRHRVLGLPDLDGVEVVRRLREVGRSFSDADLLDFLLTGSADTAVSSSGSSNSSASSNSPKWKLVTVNATSTF